MISMYVIMTAVVLLQCGGEALAKVCADDTWYFDIVTLRCKPCTVCVEELGQVELTPCDDFHDRICVDVPDSPPAEIRFPGLDLDVSTTNPDDVLVTVPDVVPDDGGSVPTEGKSVSTEISLPRDDPITEEGFRDPVQELQAIIDYQAASLIFWRYSAYGLSAALGFTIILVIVLLLCICRPVHHNSISVRKDDLENGTKLEPRDLELDYMERGLERGYGDSRRPRLFSRGRLSSADFLRSLSSHEKKRESREGLFDQMIYPPPNMYSQPGSSEEVSPDNNNFLHTMIPSSDVDSGLPNCDSSPTTSKGNIVSHEDKYSITDARMQEPVIRTQFPEFIPNSPSQKQLVAHWSHDKAVSVTTLQSYDV